MSITYRSLDRDSAEAIGATPRARHVRGARRKMTGGMPQIASWGTSSEVFAPKACKATLGDGKYFASKSTQRISYSSYLLH